MFKLLRVLDVVSGGVLVLIAVLSPWMLGTTIPSTIWVLNALGFLLGGLWLLLKFSRCFISQSARPSSELRVVRWPIACVLALVLILLSYVLCSAWNSRSSLQYTFTPGYPVASGVDIEYFDAITWLPQSHDSDLTMRAFWKYLAMFFCFVAARDWLMRSSRLEQRSDGGNLRFPNGRVQLFLWTLAINAGAVSLVGILQRLDGTEKLLWFFNNHRNGGSGAFGPFPYQANGAQYLNLMWPITVGFWWVLSRSKIALSSTAHRSGGSPHILLLVLAALTSAGVVVAKSRGGFLVLVALLLLVSGLAIVRSRRQAGFKIGIVAAAVSVLGLGGWLGGDALLARFRSEDIGKMSGRKMIYEDGSRMAEDFAVFGSGAETFAPLYYFYRKKDPDWNAYAHDDYLETRITFGRVGFVIILLIFLAVWLVPFFGNGIPAPREFIIMIGVAMLGILVHAKFDLPFQIYSIHSQFVLLCALLTTLKWQRG